MLKHRHTDYATLAARVLAAACLFLCAVALAQSGPTIPAEQPPPIVLVLAQYNGAEYACTVPYALQPGGALAVLCSVPGAGSIPGTWSNVRVETGNEFVSSHVVSAAIRSTHVVLRSASRQPRAGQAVIALGT